MTTPSMSASYQATCARLAKSLTEIALNPETTARFVAEQLSPPRGRAQEFLVTCFTLIQEDLVAAGDLDQVTRF
jgi:hypothetical protein